MDATDSRTRRLFAQEFVTQLKRLGSGTPDHLIGDGLALFSVKVKEEEVDEVGGWAERYGWAERTPGGAWRVTDAGTALPRPPSLGVGQVLIRIAHVANPARTNATDWLPLVAIVAGAVAGSFDSADAVRAISVLVLTGSLVVQFWGEYWITRACERWCRHAPAEADIPPYRLPHRFFGLVPKTGEKTQRVRNSFYTRPRLGFAGVFDLLIIGSFALLIYRQPIPVKAFELGSLTVRPWLFTVVCLALAVALVGGVLQLVWRGPRRQYAVALGLDTTVAARHAPSGPSQPQRGIGSPGATDSGRSCASTSSTAERM